MDESSRIAEIVSALWHRHRSADFPRCIAEVFGEVVTQPAEFDRLYIAELVEGDIEKSQFPSGFVRKWWVMDDNGLRDVRCPEHLRTKAKVLLP